MRELLRLTKVREPQLPFGRREIRMRTFVQDLRYAFRNLLKSRGFADGRRPDPGRRHRGQHRHLQHHRCRPAAPAPLSRSGPPRPALRNRGRTRQVSLHRTGFHRLENAEQHVFRHDPVLLAERHEPQRQGTGRLCPRRPDSGQLLLPARRQPHPGPNLGAGRGPTGQG